MRKYLVGKIGEASEASDGLLHDARVVEGRGSEEQAAVRAEAQRVHVQEAVSVGYGSLLLICLLRCPPVVDCLGEEDSVYRSMKK